MSSLISTILIIVGIAIYFVAMIFWMRYTFKYKNTVNYYIFKRSLESGKVDFMHYIEMAMTILLIIGFITTLISQVQIWVSKRRR